MTSSAAKKYRPSRQVATIVVDLESRQVISRKGKINREQSH
jgi:hypothetical protein